MISKAFFKNSPSYSVRTYEELIQLCSRLRKENKTKPYIIYIEEGRVENNNLVFPFSFFYIINKGHILESSLYAKLLDQEGNELTTWKTAALKITGSHNIFENLIINNNAGSPEIKGQEVALAIYGDDNIFINCQSSSTQDTLFVGPLPDDLCTRYIDFLPQDERYFEGNPTNYFSNCHISGSVDFIFGAGKAIFDNCRFTTVNDKRNESYVVAPAHSLKDDFGYLFYQCDFDFETGVKPQTIFLARPWRDYGKAVFAYCKYQDHIAKEGFKDWSDVNRTRTARFEEYPLQKGRVSWTHNQKDELDKKYTHAIIDFRNRLL